MPTAFAEAAVPIRKLYMWVLYFESPQPAFFNVAERRDLKCVPVRGAPLSEMNSGPGTFFKLLSKVLIGHTTNSVRPRHNLAPLQKGAVFDCLIINQMMVRAVLLSSVMSPKKRCTDES